MVDTSDSMARMRLANTGSLSSICAKDTVAVSKIPKKQPIRSDRKNNVRTTGFVRNKLRDRFFLLARASSTASAETSHAMPEPAAGALPFREPSAAAPDSTEAAPSAQSASAAPSRLASFFSHPGTGSVSFDDASKSVPTTQQIKPHPIPAIGWIPEASAMEIAGLTMKTMSSITPS